MKIAFFHNLPSGGALKLLGRTIHCLIKAGHTVQVYSLSSADHEFSDIAGIPSGVVEPFPSDQNNQAAGYFTATKKLAQKINASDADFVWVDKCRFFSSPPLLQFLKKPHLFYAHEPFRTFKHEFLIEPTPQNALRMLPQYLQWNRTGGKTLMGISPAEIKRQDRLSILRATKVITNSAFTAGWLKLVYGIKAGIVRPAVDTDHFLNETSPDKHSEVLTVGRIDFFKGYLFLIDVLSRIPESKRPVWNIAGDESDANFEKKLLSLAKKKKIAVRMHYRVTEAKLRELYKEALLTLCASYHEPFGLVPLESMASGTPVVAVRDGGFQETVRDGITGFLLPRNAELWAIKIESLMGKPDVLKKMGDQAKKNVAENWSMSRFLDDLQPWLA